MPTSHQPSLLTKPTRGSHLGQSARTRNSHVLDGGSAAALRPAADSAAWSCADSRRSSFTTVASASGLTPFSVRPTRVDSSSLSRPVCSKREMSKRTAGGKLGEWVQGLARGGGGLHAPSIVSSRVRGASGGMARRARASERPLVISAARRLRGPALAARQVRAPCSVFRKPAIALAAPRNLLGNSARPRSACRPSVA